MVEEYCDFTEIILKDTNYKDQISRYFQQTFNIYPKYKTEKYENIFRSSIYNEGKLIATGTGTVKNVLNKMFLRKHLYILM